MQAVLRYSLSMNPRVISGLRTSSSGVDVRLPLEKGQWRKGQWRQGPIGCAPKAREHTNENQVPLPVLKGILTPSCA